MMRTWTEQKIPGKAQERNNKEPYNVPTTIESQRRRLKKYPENKHLTNKAAPPNAKKKRTIKNNGCVDKAEENNNRTDEGTKCSPDTNRTTKKRAHTQRSQPKH